MENNTRVEIAYALANAETTRDKWNLLHQLNYRIGREPEIVTPALVDVLIKDVGHENMPYTFADEAAKALAAIVEGMPQFINKALVAHYWEKALSNGSGSGPTSSEWAWEGVRQVMQARPDLLDKKFFEKIWDAAQGRDWDKRREGWSSLAVAVEKRIDHIDQKLFSAVIDFAEKDRNGDVRKMAWGLLTDIVGRKPDVIDDNPELFARAVRAAADAHLLRAWKSIAYYGFNEIPDHCNDAAWPLVRSIVKQRPAYATKDLIVTAQKVIANAIAGDEREWGLVQSNIFARSRNKPMRKNGFMGALKVIGIAVAAAPSLANDGVVETLENALDQNLPRFSWQLGAGWHERSPAWKAVARTINVRPDLATETLWTHASRISECHCGEENEEGYEAAVAVKEYAIYKKNAVAALHVLSSSLPKSRKDKKQDPVRIEFVCD